LNCAIFHVQLQDSGGSASGSFEQGSNINDDIRQSATKR
jgi:poly(rC)-binding protein 3/4